MKYFMFFVLDCIFLSCNGSPSITQNKIKVNAISTKIDSLKPAINIVPFTEQFDTIDINQLVFNKLEINSKLDKLIELYGKPNNVKISKDEVYNIEEQLYAYSNFDFKIVDNKLNGFYIRDSSFVFNLLDLKVGDSNEKLKEKFPKSFHKSEISDYPFLVEIRIRKSATKLVFEIELGRIKSISYFPA